MGFACWLQVAVQAGHGLLSCLTYLELGRALENRQSLMVLCADSWAGLTHGLAAGRTTTMPAKKLYPQDTCSRKTFSRGS